PLDSRSRGRAANGRVPARRRCRPAHASGRGSQRHARGRTAARDRGQAVGDAEGGAGVHDSDGRGPRGEDYRQRPRATARHLHRGERQAASFTGAMTDPNLLADVPLFQLLDAEERAALAARVGTLIKPAGTLLFSYGDPGDSLYIVHEGEVEIFFKNDTGERVVLETAGKGDFFGEVSLLDGGPRTASAEVTKDLQAVVGNRRDLEAFLHAPPAAAIDLLTATGRRLRRSAGLLRRTASRNINEEMEDRRTVVMRTADWISEFSGSLTFLFIHCVLFFVWIVLNTGP